MVWYAEQQNLTEPAEGKSGLRPFCVPTLAGFFIGDKMKRIPLTQGQFAIVDDEDYEWLNKFKWYARWNKSIHSFYAVRVKKEKDKCNNISMAREILGLSKNDKHQPDHINHNTLNNCKSNLRVVTHQQNSFNRKSPKGYTWIKSRKKYLAQIMLNYKNIHLGYFRTTEEAHNAYLRAKENYHKS